MDKFVVRTPIRSPSSSPTKRGRMNLKQATIESLKNLHFTVQRYMHSDHWKEKITGVVIIEELERAKIVLERSDTAQELKVDTLQHLKRKRPAKEVLMKTQIGKTVHKLCKSKDVDVAAAAKEVYKLWKDHVLSKVSRPTIEVRCDAKTQSFRNTARQMLLDALKRSEDRQSSAGCDVPGRERIQEDGEHCEIKRTQEKMTKDRKDVFDTTEVLAEYLERDVYQATRRLVNNAYRRTIRRLVFTLRHQHDMRLAVISSKLSVEEFVKQHLQK